MSRLSSLPRTLRIDLSGAPAAFLWGPRKVGKSTLLQAQFPDARRYDLLDTELKTGLLLRPRLLREEVLAGLTRGLDLAVLDEGVGTRDGHLLSFFPRTEALGVVLPSNSPGVHSLWAPATVLKMPVSTMKVNLIAPIAH